MEDKFKKYKDYQTILSVNALIWSKGKVLLVKRAETKAVDPGVYSGIGGKVEPGECVYDALIREIEEETGIRDIKSVKAYSVTQHPFPPTDCEWINIYFNVEIEDQIEIPESSEGKFEWFAPEDVQGLKMVKDLQEYIGILAKNPDAFILGFFNNDKDGNPTERTIKVL